MDLIKDIISTLLAALSRGQSYRQKLAAAKKLLGSSPRVVRFAIALVAQSRLGHRSYYKRIQRGSVKGLWYGKNASRLSEEALAAGSGPIIMFIHGGAFISGQTKMWSMWNTKIIDEHKRKYNKDLRTFFVDYTLAPDQHFPYQWNESRAALDYLLRQLRVEPARLYLAGDSAGGNLCLQTLFEMENARSLAGAILFSPWVLPAATLATAGQVADTKGIGPTAESSWYSNMENDYLASSFGESGIKAYIGKSMTYEVAYTSSQINPLLRTTDEFSGLPDMLISYGEGECLRDQIVLFIDKARSAAHEVEVLSAPNGVHDWPLNEDYSPESSQYLKGIEFVSAFIEKKMIHSA